MRLFTLFLLLLAGHSFTVRAQDAEQEAGDTDPNSYPYIDAETYRNILNTRFTNIITGQSRSQIGNFAAVDPKAAQVALNGSQVFTHGDILSVNVNAGIDDGFASIFSNSKLNSNVGIDIKYSLLYHRDGYIPHSRIRMTKPTRLRYIADTALVNKSYEVMKNKLQQDSELAVLDRKKAQKKMDAIEDAIEAIEKKGTREQRHSGSHEFNKLDSLNYERIQLAQKIDELDVKILSNKTRLKSLTTDLDKKLDDSLETLQLKLAEKLTNFKINWFNLHYKVLNNSFKTFDASLSYGDQVQKRNYVTHTLGFEFNMYNWNVDPFQSYYLLLGAEGFVTDNKSDLQQVQLNEVTQYGATPGQRSSTKQYNVYTGKYETGIVGAHLYADYYHFLFKNNIAALHVYPEAILKANSFCNLGLGFLYAFKDKKDPSGKSIVNAELYVKFNDLFDAGNSSDPFFKRNDIGLRFAFPINFYTN